MANTSLYDDFSTADFTPDAPVSHYILPDGRIWELETGRFVSELPEEAVPHKVEDKEDRSALEITIQSLKFYGYPLGELTPVEDLAAQVRATRDQKLAATDYMLMSDYPIDNDKRQKVMAYRQTLRDITKLDGFPWDGDAPWPEL